MTYYDEYMDVALQLLRAQPCAWALLRFMVYATILGVLAMTATVNGLMICWYWRHISRNFAERTKPR